MYAAVGMNLFGGICYDAAAGGGGGGYVCENINENANFDSMATALVTLFRMLTGESWNAIAHDCAMQTGQMAMAYFMSFVMFGQVSGQLSGGQRAERRESDEAASEAKQQPANCRDLLLAPN